MTFIDLLRDFPKSFDFVINEFIISKRHVHSLDFPSIRPTYIYSRGQKRYQSIFIIHSISGLIYKVAFLQSLLWALFYMFLFHNNFTFLKNDLWQIMQKIQLHTQQQKKSVMSLFLQRHMHFYLDLLKRLSDPNSYQSN